MSYAAAKTSLVKSVIDVRPLRSGNRQAMQEVARQLPSSQDWLFCIRNHCIPSQVIQQACGNKTVFSTAEDWKNQLRSTITTMDS